MVERAETQPPHDSRKELADCMRDFFMQALAQEQTVRDLAEEGRQIATGNVYKLDGQYIKIRLDPIPEDKDFSGDPHLAPQTQETLELSEENRAVLQSIGKFPTIWGLINRELTHAPDDSEELTALELAVIYSEEIILHVEGDYPEIVIVSDENILSSSFFIKNIESVERAEEDDQMQKAEYLLTMVRNNYNLRTLGRLPSGHAENQ